MKCGQMHASILEDFPARTLVPVKPQEWEGKDLAEEGRYAAWTPGSICSVTLVTEHAIPGRRSHSIPGEIVWGQVEAFPSHRISAM